MYEIDDYEINYNIDEHMHIQKITSLFHWRNETYRRGREGLNSFLNDGDYEHHDVKDAFYLLQEIGNIINNYEAIYGCDEYKNINNLHF